MVNAKGRIEDLSLGFRNRFLDYRDLTRQLKAWSAAFPHLARVESIGKSPEGRDLWLITIGTEPERLRPAAWVDGNMHAVELCGSSAALAIAEDLLSLHLGIEGHPWCCDLPQDVQTTLKTMLVYVLPRISPDGAEAVLKTGRRVRSSPRDDRLHRNEPRWVAEDIDGDGQLAQMRIQDSSGDMIQSREFPGLMLPREIGDEGPYYRVYPEGRIENFDGETIPAPEFLSDNAVDFNRNFPWSWKGEPDQAGAGEYPGSAPEVKAVMDFAVGHPNIFYWLNFHTFGGVFIRPLSHLPDKNMDRSDLMLFKQIETWGEELTGYPTVSGFEDFCYEPEKPLHGDITDFAYHQRGCIAYCCELWDFFTQVGLPRRKPFVDSYSMILRKDLEMIAAWDRDHNKGRIFRHWRPCKHPQLGDVEVGGMDARVGICNPPLERIDETCRTQSAMFARVAAMAPKLHLEVRMEGPKGEHSVITAIISNVGYLPTYILSSSRRHPINESIWVEIELDGVERVQPGPSRQDLGHLDGWGRGLYQRIGSLFSSASKGSVNRRTLTWTVCGRGRCKIRVGNCRMGFVERIVEV